MHLADGERTGRLYTQGHLWLFPEREGGPWRLGVTDRSMAVAGEPRFVSFDTVEGASIRKGCPLARIETEKWVGRVDAPLDAKVEALNHRLIDDPDPIRGDPFGDGWLALLHPLSDPFQDEGLMTEDVYVGKARRKGAWETKAPGGLVRAEVEIDGGTLICVKFTGDFDMQPSVALEEMEKRLARMAIDDIAVTDVIADVYKEFDVESPGLRQEDIAGTVMSAIGSAVRR